MNTHKIPTAKTILTAGCVGLVFSILINSLIRFVTISLVDVSPKFIPLSISAPIIFTIAGVLGAVIVFWIVARKTKNPKKIYSRIAFIVLLLSIIPDLLFLSDPNASENGANPVTVSALILMHIATYLIIVPLLKQTLSSKQKGL